MSQFKFKLFFFINLRIFNRRQLYRTKTNFMSFFPQLFPFGGTGKIFPKYIQNSLKSKYLNSNVYNYLSEYYNTNITKRNLKFIVCADMSPGTMSLIFKFMGMNYTYEI